MRYTYKKGALKTLRTRLTSLSSAVVLSITSLSGAAPLFLTQKAYADTIPSVPSLDSPAQNASLNYGTVTLTWKASTGGNGTLFYNVEVGTANPIIAPAYTKNATQSTSYSPGVLPANTYYWHVQACNDASGNHCSAWSAAQGFTVLPATPVLGAENFNTVNDSTYKGISVGFNAKDFTDISAVTVDMTRSDGTHAVKHGTSDLFSLIEANASPYQFTAPFVIQSGSYDPATDSYWTSDPTTWSVTTVPSSVTITITYQNGLTEHVTNSTFDAGPLSWPTYDSLLPPAKPAAPTDLTIAYAGAASNLTANTDGNYVVRNVSKNIKLSWVNDPGADITGVRTHVVFPDGTSKDFSQGTPYTYTNLNPRDSGNKFAADGAGKYTYTVEVRNVTGWSAYSAPLVIYYAPNIPTATFKTAPPSYVNGNFQVTIVGGDTSVLQDVGADVRDPSAPAGTNSYVTGCTNGQLLGGATLPAYSNDGSGVTVEKTCTINTANLVNGHTYTLRARASFIEADGQSYGNVNSGSTWTFTYDTSKPVISNLKAVVNNSKTYNLTTKNTPLLVKSGDSVTVTIQVDGTGSPVDWATVRAYEQNVAAGNWHTYLFQDQTMTDNGDGTYSYTFTVPDKYTTGDSINQNPYKNAIDFNTKDQAGNTRGTELYFTIDNTAPEMTDFKLTPLLVGGTVSGPTLTGDISDATSNVTSVKYALFPITGTDAHGNYTYGPYVCNWTDVPAADHTYDSMSEQVNSAVQCYVHGTGDLTAASDLPSGTYELRVRGWDAAGNKSGGSNIVFTVDNTAPTIKIDGATPKALYGSNDLMKFFVDDANLAHTYFYVGTTQFKDYGSAQYFNTRWLPDGTYDVYSVDQVGNESVHYEFQFDKTAPGTPTADPAGGNYVGPQQVSLSATDNTGGSGVASIYYTTDGTTPSDTKGTLYDASNPVTISTDTTLKAIAYDEAGNAGPVMTETYGIAPIITGEAALTPTTTTITLQWDTNEPATSRVIYDSVSHASLGVPPNYGYAFSTVEDSNKVTPHSVTITGLTPGTQYYFRMVSHGSPEAVSSEVSSITKVKSAGGGTPTFHVSFTPTPAANNGQAAADTTTASPQVLGASTDGDNGSDTSGSKTATFASDVQAKNDAGKGSDFLGLGWWWLAVLAALLAFYLAVIRRSDSNSKN